MTFDLKRARELVWAASELKIWTPPGGTGYGLDLDKHREWQAVVEICDKQFPSAIDEIERLRAEHEAVLLRRNKIINKQDAKIKELEANCIYDPETGKVFVPDGHPELEKLRARNRDLEDALVEERARGNHYGMSYEEATDGNFERWIIDGEKDLPKFYLDRVRTEARRQLQAEGKIGPGADAKPHCWQITEERKAAIKELSELLTAIGCPSCHYYIQKNYGEDITVLRAMLTEAGQE